MFAGMWFGNGKPNMLRYFQPFHSCQREMETLGVPVVSPEAGNFICRVLLLAGTCNLPAKCLVFNTIQLNGFYGCLKCKQPGKSVTVHCLGRNSTLLSIRKGKPKGA